MDKVNIMAVVQKNILQTFEDIDAEDLDPQRAMVDYGASSLDIVIAINQSMKDLNITIPRQDLVHVENIDALVALFEKNDTKFA